MTWYELYPERFQNKTNGITQRRWLGLCNPELSAMLTEKIGDGFLTDLYQLEKLRPMIDDETVRPFHEIKQLKKASSCLRRFCSSEGVAIDPELMFDVQVKRLHEYKRQLMNALSILDIYYPTEGRHTCRTSRPRRTSSARRRRRAMMRAKAIIQLYQP